MAWPSHVWDQLKNLTASELARAVERDGWARDTKGGSAYIYVKKMPGQATRRVSIHFHPHKTYGAKMLQGLIDDIGWTEDDLRSLKLIK